MPRTTSKTNRPDRYRWVVACVASVIAALMLSTAASAQSPSPSQSASPSPSPSTSALPEGAAIKLLNPSSGYTVAGTGGQAQLPIVSDEKHGAESGYHITAWVHDPPESPLVEAVLQRGPNLPELEIGVLTREGDTNVFGLHWDVPDSLLDGSATISVRLYAFTIDGYEELAQDSVAVELRHRHPTLPSDRPGEIPPRPPSTDVGSDETVEIVWPEHAGQLGFFQPRGGVWRTAIKVHASAGTRRLQAFYSKSLMGDKPVFTACGARPASATATVFEFHVTCTLRPSDPPSQITAVAVVAMAPDGGVDAPQTATPESADVHAVQTYLQDPAQMELEIDPFVRELAGDCVTMAMTVTDQLGAAVQGANLDVHVSGPTDNAVFGTIGASGSKIPDGGSHSTERGWDCVDALRGGHGEHNVPGGTDIKHKETSAGSGVSGPSIPPGGQWRITMMSPDPGFTEVTAWVDEETVPDETTLRPLDDDMLEEGEAFATGRFQWYSAPLKLSIDPVGASVPIGTCAPFVVKARSGRTPVPGLNVDVHATGPDNELDFCDPPSGTLRNAPAPENHFGEDPGESHHGDASPHVQHSEGETDDSGNRVIGLVSLAPGDTTISAWADGEVGSDNDIPAPGEATALGTASWFGSVEDAEVSFLSPSDYGGSGDTISFKTDGGNDFRVIVRSDMADQIPGIEILLNNGPGGAFKIVGLADRIPGTDAFALQIDPSLGLVTGRLRAQISGTQIFEEIPITIGPNQDNANTPDDERLESVELDQPSGSFAASFVKGEVPVSGVASAGAEGLDLFYTRASSKDTPKVGDWISCGYVDLSGTGSTPQQFKGSCELQDADQPAQVTGLSAVTYDCTQPGCDASPPAPPLAEGAPQLPRAPGARESGDALRVFGLEADPLLDLEPAEEESDVGACQAMEVIVRDQTGQPMRGVNVDLQAFGPTADISLCTPEGINTEFTEVTVADPAGTLQAEGVTGPSGKVVVGLSSARAGDMQLMAWIDATDDDLATDDVVDPALLHWLAPRGCTIVGTAGDDVLRGTRGSDRICGLGGADVIVGRAGNDVIFGGPGNDQLRGGRGIDVIRGGPGHDALFGGPGSDRCTGGVGRDRSSKCGPPRDTTRQGR